MSTTRQRAHRNPFGGVRRLPSGRYQVRYLDPSGERRTAPQTFTSKREAGDWLATSRADIVRGTWRDPDAGSETLADYLSDWIATRTDLAPRTVEIYRESAERWITGDLQRPATSRHRVRPLNLGSVELRHLTVAMVRDWYAAAVHTQEVRQAERTARAATAARDRAPTAPIRAWARAHGHTVADTGRLSPRVVTAWKRAGSPGLPPVAAAPSANPRPRASVAQAYRTLRAALNAAVQDGLIVANPCQVPRAADVKAAERKPATTTEIVALADAMPGHLSAAVHVAAFTGLRAGELFALSREHVDLDAGTVRVERALLELNGQPVTFGPPKTDSSRRTVHMPPHVVDLLREHLSAYTRRGASALVFANLDGSPVTTSQRTGLFARARRKVNRPDLRWHDLRHTGATLAAQAGASVRELQHRLGHSTIAAAMRYQHAEHARDRDIAARLSVLATTQRSNVIALHA